MGLYVPDGLAVDKQSDIVKFLFSLLMHLLLIVFLVFTAIRSDVAFTNLHYHITLVLLDCNYKLSHDGCLYTDCRFHRLLLVSINLLY